MSGKAESPEHGRCATCKHWQQWRRDEGSCHKVAFDDTAIAWVESDDDDYPRLMTMPDFGCVMWVTK